MFNWLRLWTRLRDIVLLVLEAENAPNRPVTVTPVVRFVLTKLCIKFWLTKLVPTVEEVGWQVRPSRAMLVMFVLALDKLRMVLPVAVYVPNGEVALP